MGRQLVWKKQPAEAELKTDSLWQRSLIVYCDKKIELPVMGNKTLFVRPCHMCEYVEFLLFVFLHT